MHKIKFVFAIALLLTFNASFALSLSIPKSLIDLAVVKKFPRKNYMPLFIRMMMKPSNSGAGSQIFPKIRSCVSATKIISGKWGIPVPVVPALRYMSISVVIPVFMVQTQN